MRGKADLINILQNLFIKNLYDVISEEEMEEFGKKIANREKDPYGIIEEIIPRLKKFL
jgi:hypothetical protein